MKVYYYTNEDHGYERDASGLRFDNIETVDRPEDADLLLVGTTIRSMRFKHGDDPRKLKYIRKWPDRHVLWDMCDHYDTFPGLESTMFIRTVVDADMLRVHPKTACQPWAADDYSDIAADYDNIKHVVSFVGWDSGPMRHIPATACKRFFGEKAEIGLKHQFFAYYPEDTQKLFRQQFLDSLRSSHFILAPPSIYYPGRRPTGFVPYRFYEAMSAGRVPVHVGEKPILPFQNHIDWDECYVHVPMDYANRTEQMLLAWWHTRNVKDAGKRNREIWKKWLNREDWPTTHRLMVEEMMAR